MKLLTLLLLGSFSALAQWSGQITLEQHVLDGPDTQEIGLYTFYKFPKNGRLALRLEAALNNSEFNIKDGRLRFTNNMHSVNNISLDSDIRLGLGLSEGSREASPFLTYLTWAPSVWIDLNEKNDETKFAFMFKPYVTRQLYDEDYTFTELGGGLISQQAKVRHNIYNLFMLEVNFQKRFTLDLGYAYLMQWNVEGNRVDDTHDLWQEFVTRIDETFTLVLGHSNSGQVYDQDGEQNRIALGGKGQKFYVNLNIAIDL